MSSQAPKLSQDTLTINSNAKEEKNLDNSITIIPALPNVSHQQYDSMKSCMKNGSNKNHKNKEICENRLYDTEELSIEVEPNSILGDEFFEALDGEYRFCSKERNNFWYWLEVFKCAYSTVLFVFCACAANVSIMEGQTKVAVLFDHHITPVIGCLLVWFLIVLLALLEGGQVSIVGLRNVNGESYLQSHPTSHRIVSVVNEGDNLERYIAGRQFIASVLVFLINFCGTSLQGYSLPGVPSVVNFMFMTIGIAMIVFTIIFGQLAAQISATTSMLDFINNKIIFFMTHLSLAVEFTGILHAVYPVQILFARITGKQIGIDRPSRSNICKIFFWLRVIFSVAILLSSFAITLEAVSRKWTNMWGDLNSYFLIVIFFVCLLFVGMLEGLQIALYSVARMPEEYFATHEKAFRYSSVVFEANKLQSFLIGRQICVTAALFVIARITTLNPNNEEILNGQTLFGLPVAAQKIFNLGIFGAIATTLMGSLVWRVVASSFPILFLSNPLVTVVIYLCLSIEVTGLCSASWVLSRWQNMFFKFQPDDVYLEGEPRETSIPSNSRDEATNQAVMLIKCTYSVAFLVFSAALFMEAIFTGQTVVFLKHSISPAVSCVIFWSLIVWLALVEGGQGCLVGLSPIDRNLYKSSHCLSSYCTSCVNKSETMEQFLIGRQFIVVTIIFILNTIGETSGGVNVWGFPEVVSEIFLSTGLGVISITIVLGQLAAQINAASYMLDFLNNIFMLVTVHLAFVVECTGLLHCIYLFRVCFSKFSNSKTTCTDERSSFFSKSFFYLRVLLSLAVLCGSVSVIIVSYSNGWTNNWENIPTFGAILIFISLLLLLATLEGLQIALFSAVDFLEEKVHSNWFIRANCELAFREGNLQALLVGRQAWVTVCIFVIARLTSINTEHADLINGITVFELPSWFQEFVNLGFTAIFATVVLGTLMGRLIASNFPLAFLSNPLLYTIIRICILVDTIGIFSAAWPIALMNRTLLFFKTDEYYLAKSDTRAKMGTMRVADLEMKSEVSEMAY
mmetsp:Transcript_6145/g.13277  ORF Transcript_6145/g.13277 Transcript_6145/m.13277 type:complete len:1023 (-) Transcript_6145:104-3172(-)